MVKTRVLVIGALMAAVAAIFQSLPVLFSEIVIILTILSALPIYTASRINPVIGVLAYIVAAALIFLVSTHEALFFLCTNGVVGISLGISRYFKLKKPVILTVSAFAMTISLCVMNFGIGIPIFGAQLPGVLLVQILILFLFSAVYNFLYLLFADFIYKRLKIAGITGSSPSL